MGGVIPGEADYLDIGEMLSLEIRRDFTYIHPEILDDKCRVDGNRIRLMNELNPEEFKIIIVPGSKTIQLDNLKKIKSFYDEGGTVIATSALPDHSAEAGKDDEVKQLVKAMFGDDPGQTPDMIRTSASSNWNTGGFIPSYAIDGKLETSWKPSQGSLTGEYLEIGLGGKRSVSQVKINGADDRLFGFKLLYRSENEWIDVGNGKGTGYEKSVAFSTIVASAIRIVLETGDPEKVLIPDVEILDPQDRNILSELKPYTLHANNSGGRAYFIPAPHAAMLKKVLDDTGHSWDVRFENDISVSGGNLSYLHKKLNGKDIFFFANSSETTVDVTVLLNGDHKLQLWNPHNGHMTHLATVRVVSAGNKSTKAQLKLEPETSVFWVGE
jgi:hypothetical protein